MKMQYDGGKRTVLVENLRAMCVRVSGVCHKFRVDVCRPMKTRVRVWYSNPDEYGNERPLYAVFPCYPSGDDGNPFVVLDILDVNTADGEGWRLFHPLLDCPPLFRDPADGAWIEDRKTVSA